MIIEFGVNPNCSDATLRIALKGQDEAKIKALKKKLDLELNGDDYNPKVGEWDDDKKSKEFDFSEGFVDDKHIFGMRVLEIKGDAPYNYGDDILGIVARYLPTAKVEWSEQ
jgi:acylphosphatase